VVEENEKLFLPKYKQPRAIVSNCEKEKDRGGCIWHGLGRSGGRGSDTTGEYKGADEKNSVLFPICPSTTFNSLLPLDV